ncbi:DUF4012 domain-containing protein [Arthrobacter sp. 135MFCol5.1]|uniref:DUF4012 domain-containing protein n=1 Tax=Arthrobacter sp. 135MFCol5.1 TaxID=1158050 RepID=UPI0003A55FDB|nr:DUF4012 domain-containing protein [Arthrobacter sp. 135MFCol5.1]
MTDSVDDSGRKKRGGATPGAPLQTRRRRIVGLTVAGIVVCTGVVCAASLGVTAAKIRSELEISAGLVPTLKSNLETDKFAEAAATAETISVHTAAAKEAADSPLWVLASSMPGLGKNFGAVAEVARSGDDVARLALLPLVKVFDDLDWASLLPGESATNLSQIKAAAPGVSSAAQAVRLSSERLNAIDTSSLLPQVAQPLSQARDQLGEVIDALNAAADAAGLAPSMLGAESPRSYLLMIQNNAESRASGGIPGALAEITFENGHINLGRQSTATDLGPMSPTLNLDEQQQQIYTTRPGKYMQDVNLTPDFPTAASAAQAMWEKKTGQRVEGVISIDPVVLGYILQATGPVSITGPELAAVKAAGLPTELTGTNVVQTLLSDVYAKIQQPKLQDAYFAGVAKEVFSALSTGKGEAKGLISGITRGTEEGRVLVWSADNSEQSIISRYPVSGSISGPSVAPAQFGLYFNDGTGAKMDYYVKRTVQLVKECPKNGYEQTTVRVTSTNTAPTDAATSLPAYVTGGGNFGVAPGKVLTNIVAYGPAQANVESATVNGEKTPFAPYLHADRPVGVIAQQLAPSESQTVEFTFGKIVQHTEPNLVVTPTVQSVKDVILPTKNASCDQGQ